MSKRYSASERYPQLTELLRSNAEINALLDEQVKAELSELHAPIERLGSLLAKPAFFLTALGLFVAWILLNLDLKFTHVKPWDEPPFYWLQGLIGLLSLIFTATVLISQTRQAQLAEQRAQLQLQMIVLIEQRTAKLIGLIEELRSDLPEVPDRIDPEAEMMQQVSEPAVILEVLTEQEQALREQNLAEAQAVKKET